MKRISWPAFRFGPINLHSLLDAYTFYRLQEGRRPPSYDYVHYHADFSPKKCRDCGCEEFEEVVIDTLDGWCVMEFEVRCRWCDEVCGYWAHGHYDPCFAVPEL
ncbi:hypothetical protein [uncultured Halomonas sp.]|uniref:hypothetical protein n=1 Tax=uncultured Halomonas sp. TaxID=173971 RepID=UPI0026311E57|nr:hypothetical protein [uncultured Halomonas sp.]